MPTIANLRSSNSSNKQQKAQQKSFLRPTILIILAFLTGFHGGTTYGGGGWNPVVVNPSNDQDDTSTTQEQVASALSPTTTDSPAEHGWGTVNVFYGNRDTLVAEAMNHGIQNDTFSQAGQDRYALELLGGKRNGFFVDLAANHALLLSNTYLLERDYDWNGICIEPNWQYWNGLASLRKCTVVGAVGGSPLSSEEIKFRFHPSKPFIGAFGGIEKLQGQPKHGEELLETRFTIGLSQILDKFHAPATIDYLSLDVEGAEELIFADFPFDRYTFLVMNVERPKPKLRAVLEQHGYVKLRTDKWGDTIWKHNSLP